MLAHSSQDVIDRSSRWIPKKARALLAEANGSIVKGIEAAFEAPRPDLDLGDALSFREISGWVGGHHAVGGGMWIGVQFWV